jgi:acyl dehydratase
MTVEAGKVREFALAVRSADPEHLGDRPVSPPTFLQTCAWWQTPESSVWHGTDRDYSRLLHGSQEFVFHGEPPRAGDELEAVSRIDGTYRKQGRRGGAMAFTDVVTEFRDIHTGRLVAESRNTSTWPAAGSAVPAEVRSETPRRVTWDEVHIGTSADPFVAPPLTVTDFVRYQGASGDMNPIHHDSTFAAAAGYPRPFAVGMLQAGVLGTYVTDWFGPRSVRRFGTQFREQAWPGDALTYSGSVVAKREEGGDRLVDVELLVTRQTGGIHIKGWATVAL